MPSDDMDSIPGLEENHRRALAGKLGITSLRALADADQRAIYTALASYAATSVTRAHRGLAGPGPQHARRCGE